MSGMMLKMNKQERNRGGKLLGQLSVAEHSPRTLSKNNLVKCGQRTIDLGFSLNICSSDQSGISRKTRSWTLILRHITKHTSQLWCTATISLEDWVGPKTMPLLSPRGQISRQQYFLHECSKHLAELQTERGKPSWECLLSDHFNLLLDVNLNELTPGLRWTENNHHRDKKGRKGKKGGGRQKEGGREEGRDRQKANIAISSEWQRFKQV